MYGVMCRVLGVRRISYSGMRVDATRLDERAGIFEESSYFFGEKADLSKNCFFLLFFHIYLYIYILYFIFNINKQVLTN